MKPLALVSAAALALAAGSAMAQVHDIAPGQIIHGILGEDDRLPNDEPGACYRFTLQADSQVTIVLRSPALDTYLYVFEGAACGGEVLYQDDDGDGDLNSRLSERMTAGVYSIGASTLSDALDDEYSVTLTAVQAAPPPRLPSLSAILAERDQPSPPPPPPPPAPATNLSDMTRPLSSILADTPPPPAAPVGPQRPYLRLDDEMIAFLSTGSPQRNGGPFICWNLPGEGRVAMRLGADFPGKLELFDGADCPGQPVFTGAMSAGDVGYQLEADTSASRPRSVGVSSATGQLGAIAMSAERSRAAAGPASGSPLRPGIRTGSLSSPLAPSAVANAPGYTSDNITCRAAYDALAEYRGDGSLYSPRLSVVSNAEYRRRHGLIPASTDELGPINEDILSARFFGALATAVMSPGDNDDAVHALMVAYQCDNRFGFTPVTGAPG